MNRYAVFVISLLAAGCGRKEPQGLPMLPSEVIYAPVLEIEIGQMSRSESGLYTRVLTPGTGEPAGLGDTLSVGYVLWLPDGRKMDASADHQPPGPLEMVLGETQLIAGWVEAVTGMRLGERRRAVLPYHLGYGTQGAGGANGIPPYATLVFELELVGLRPASPGPAVP